jgi:hypothetical protein
MAAGFLTAAVSAPGQTFFVSLYVPEISAALGLAPLSISLVYGVATLSGAALLPFLGFWADRSSAARFLGTVVVGLGLSLLVLATAQGPIMLAAAWTLSRCLGQGAVGVGMLAALSRTFHARRGRALAIGTLGYPFGEFIFPALVAGLLAFTAWRQSLLLLAGLYLVLFSPLVVGWLRSAPHVDPAAPATSDDAGCVRSGLSVALRTPLFWTATLVLTVAPIVVTALLFHQVAFFERAGLARTQVPIALMYFAAAQVGATVLAGSMIDRGRLRAVLALSCLLLAAAPLCFALPLPGAARVGFYGLALGFATGSAGVVGAALWPAYFGLAAVGSIRALTSGIRNAATAGAPVALALVIQWGDLWSARLALAALGASALLCTALLPATRPVRTPVAVSPRPARADGYSA